MSCRNWFVLSFMVITLSIITSAQEFDGCSPFEEVSWENITRDPSSLNDPNGRPLGYVQTVIPYGGNNPNAKNPCYTLQLTDSNKQTVQLRAIGATGFPVICVKSNRAGAQKNCQSGLTSCTDNAIGGSNEIKYVFSCQGCEADVPIWLRFNVSHLITDGLEFETWCSNTDAQYPQSLIALPLLPTQASTTKKSAAPIMLSVTLILSVPVIAFWLIN